MILHRIWRKISVVVFCKFMYVKVVLCFPLCLHWVAQAKLYGDMNARFSSLLLLMFLHLYDAQPANNQITVVKFSVVSFSTFTIHPYNTYLLCPWLLLYCFQRAISIQFHSACRTHEAKRSKKFSIKVKARKKKWNVKASERTSWTKWNGKEENQLILLRRMP